MAQPVYSELHHEGLRFQLYSDGTYKVWSKYTDPEVRGPLQHGDSGKPWIPKNKNFNSLVKWAYREGDFDDIVKHRERMMEIEKRARKNCMEMLQALEAIRDILSLRHEVEAHLGESIWDSITGVREAA